MKTEYTDDLSATVHCLSNLRKTANLFDDLTILDNGATIDMSCLDPKSLAFFRQGLTSLLVLKEEMRRLVEKVVS